LDRSCSLQHLLKLEGVAASADTVPETLADFFLETGTLVQEIDRLLSERPPTLLSQSSAQPEISRQKLAADLLDKLQALYHNALEELQKLDQLWISTHQIAPELSDCLQNSRTLDVAGLAQLKSHNVQCRSCNSFPPTRTD